MIKLRWWILLINRQLLCKWGRWFYSVSVCVGVCVCRCRTRTGCGCVWARSRSVSSAVRWTVSPRAGRCSTTSTRHARSSCPPTPTPPPHSRPTSSCSSSGGAGEMRMSGRGHGRCWRHSGMHQWVMKTAVHHRCTRLTLVSIIAGCQQPLCSSVLFHYTRSTASFPAHPGYASTRKVKPVWIYMGQEMMGFCDAVASAGLYANSLHLAPDR